MHHNNSFAFKIDFKEFYFNNYTNGIIGRGIAAVQGVILVLS